VALLLKDREASPEAAPPPPDGAVAATAPDYACEVCGGAMERGQDWCLECGSAAPGRLGARPGWRAAFMVVGLTTVLLLCAVIAAYAALTSDAERSASAPPAGSADPVTAQAPAPVPPTTPGTVVQPGATGPNTTAPAPAPAPPAGTKGPLIPTLPLPGAKLPAGPAAPPAAAPGKTAAAPGAAGAPQANAPAAPGTNAPAAPVAGPETIALSKDAAKTYDQPARAGAEFGPAANAIDDKPGSVWDVVVPADGQPIAAGLVIDLGKPYALQSLRLATPTDGFTVQIYGAKSAKELPEDVIDKRWIHLTDSKSTLDDDPIRLKGKGEGAKVQLVLLYFTAPADPTDPRVAIGNVTLRGTP
jgi:hypothetical protein